MIRADWYLLKSIFLILSFFCKNIKKIPPALLQIGFIYRLKEIPHGFIHLLIIETIQVYLSGG